MTPPDVPPPFIRHQKTAEALLQTLAEALAPICMEKGALDEGDVRRAVRLMLRHGPKLEPLFAANCRACVAAATPPQERMAAYQADERRRDFVTRLLFAAVSLQTPESVDPLTGEVFPRVLAGPLQNHVAGLFYEKEWEAMNADALLVFQKAGSDSGEAVWEALRQDQALPFVADVVFIRVLLRFKQFAFQRQNFIRRMGEMLKERRFVLTEEQFMEIFDAMFGRLRDGLESELGRARIDTRYGEETASAMLRIFDEFDKRRQELATPVRSLGGGQKTMQAQRQVGMTARLTPRGARF